MRLSLAQTLPGEARPTPAGRRRTGWHHASHLGPPFLSPFLALQGGGAEKQPPHRPASRAFALTRPLLVPLLSPPPPTKRPKAPAGSGSGLIFPPSPQAPSQGPHAFQQRAQRPRVCPAGRVLGGDSWEQALGVLWGRPPPYMGRGAGDTPLGLIPGLLSLPGLPRLFRLVLSGCLEVVVRGISTEQEPRGWRQAGC